LPGLRPTLGHPWLLHASRAAAGDGRCCSHPCSTTGSASGGVPDAFGPLGTVPCPGTGGLGAATRPGGEMIWATEMQDIQDVRRKHDVT